MAAAGAAGAGISFLGAMYQGQQAQQQANFNAAVAEKNARLSKQKAAVDEQRSRVASKKQLGSIRAGYAASGVNLEGTALDVLSESAATAELDALTIRYGGEMESQAFSEQAVQDRRAGEAAKTGSYMSGAGSLLMGGAQAYKSF